jgi:hypothetical protein
VREGFFRRDGGSRLEEAEGDAIVAVELNVIERGGDSIPTGHGGRLAPLHVSPGGENYTAVAHRLADEDDFDLEGSANGEVPRTQEVDAGGADVASDERDGEFFGDMVNAA